MRVYTRLREMFLTNKDILLKLEQIENKVLNQDHQTERLENDIQLIFNALKELLNPPQEPRKPIGFGVNLD